MTTLSDLYSRLPYNVLAVPPIVQETTDNYDDILKQVIDSWNTYGMYSKKSLEIIFGFINSGGDTLTIIKKLLNVASMIPIPGLETGLSLVNFFLDIFFPKKTATTNIWDQIKDRVEQMIDQKIQAAEFESLTNKFKGLEDAVSAYQTRVDVATCNGSKPTFYFANDETDPCSQNGNPNTCTPYACQTDNAEVTSTYNALDLIFTKALPDFNVKKLEAFSLPMFTIAATMHLTLIRRSIEHGKQLGLTQQTIDSRRADLQKKIKNYSKIAYDTYQQGLQSITNQNYPKGSNDTDRLPNDAKTITIGNYIQSMTVNVWDIIAQWPILDNFNYFTNTKLEQTRILSSFSTLFSQPYAPLIILSRNNYGPSPADITNGTISYFGGELKSIQFVAKQYYNWSKAFNITQTIALPQKEMTFVGGTEPNNNRLASPIYPITRSNPLTCADMFRPLSSIISAFMITTLDNTSSVWPPVPQPCPEMPDYFQQRPLCCGSCKYPDPPCHECSTCYSCLKCQSNTFISDQKVYAFYPLVFPNASTNGEEPILNDTIIGYVKSDITPENIIGRIDDKTKNGIISAIPAEKCDRTATTFQSVPEIVNGANAMKSTINEKLTLPITNLSTGAYKIRFRVATSTDSGALKYSIQRNNLLITTNTIQLPNTDTIGKTDPQKGILGNNGYYVLFTEENAINIPAGNITLEITNIENTSVILDRIEFVPSPPSP
ncbi:insecticidal delta-endotoxin Cry8Ea1 family protein, partial [Bacillus wiedmannii]|uniref:insecticidal delta-endotoxin Cry8Ea1 family protein n=1 Tax=Bacillus wiedmannii TaxID=1890302 RepID=UPI000BEC792A